MVKNCSSKFFRNVSLSSSSYLLKLYPKKCSQSCCNIFGIHTLKGNRRNKGSIEITLEIAKILKKEFPGTSVVPGKKLCITCWKKVSDLKRKLDQKTSEQ